MAGLPYLDGTEVSPDGVACRVLDAAAVDFSRAPLGRKSSETFVREAAGGERIETRDAEGRIESVHVARKGEAIFVNPHDPRDVYVPADPDGRRWRVDELAARGYATIRREPDGGLAVRNDATFRVLPGAVREPVCIRDAWGRGGHQFLHEGAALKRGEDGRVTGISREAFDATWEILPGTAADDAPGAGTAAPRRP